MNWAETFAVVVVKLSNLTVLAMFLYLIVEHDWSAWWIVVAVMLWATAKTGKAAESAK